MAAPTPVSALVHSSTLVTAGVYLLYRFHPALSFSSAKYILLITGTLTIFMAGVAALSETDMKKIVALSTLRQLGVMMATLGAGFISTAFFHLVAHAYFKALLFMSVGAMIHMARDYQDLRKISIFSRHYPLTLAFSLGANLSLCGLPFSTGFYSKDQCLELALNQRGNTVMLFLLFVATALTAAYTTRFVLLIVLSPANLPSLF